MTPPTVSIIPLYGAIAAHRSVTLDVLIRIDPPVVEAKLDRPPLNLGFVLDRSGSMQGAKIDYARKAVAFGVEQLWPSDRLSLTLFDTDVVTAIPSTLATDKQTLLERIRRIQTGSSTALHAGWVNGGMQVSQYLNPSHLNRVILLSDGLANVGETNPDAIATDVHGLAQRGVTTTTLGIGADYDENLLEAMARSGDGNFFHIDSPDQLPAVFETELQGLAATVGKAVTLSLTPQQGALVTDVLNELDRTPEGALKLPNLTVGNPLKVLLRLQVPALAVGSDVLQIRLSWEVPQVPEPLSLTATLLLEVVNPEQMSDFPAHPEVQEQVALLMAARARQEAIRFADQGMLAEAASTLRSCATAFAAMAPASAQADQEVDALQELADNFRVGETIRARKQAKSQAYNLNRSRSSDYGKRQS